MPTDINKGFDNGDLLRDIRVDILNPVTVKVKDLEKSVKDARDIAEHAFNSVTVDLGNKQLDFHGVQGGGTANLDGMFKEGVDLSIQGETGPAVTPTTAIKFRDGKVRRVNGSPTEVSYEWKTIVPTHQTKLTVGKTGVTATTQPDALFFKGDGITVENTVPNITTVTIPPATPLTAAILSGMPQTITEIQLEGEVNTSNISNGKLTIDLSKGGGGGTVTNQNFKGFYDTLGDLVSSVTDALNGKSFAYVKDSQLGGAYYTAYWYVSNGWTELKQDPALIYNDPQTPTPAGVFSIKPSDKITVDANGQLDLDGLSTPQLPSHFKGFFNTLAELKAAVTKPVNGQDWAYVKGPGGWMIYRAGMQGSASNWQVVAPLGSIAVVDKKEGPSSFAQSYGIYKSDSWDLDSKGILSLKPVDTTTNIVISDQSGGTVGGKISTIKFDEGKSFAEVDVSTLTIKNPQRVIEYNSTWERAHATPEYRGNIFFDASSRTWMGWCDPEQGGAVGAKWTRIAHADMSLEVKDLVKRVPPRAPNVTPGGLGDSRLWDYNGVTYLESDNNNLPIDIQNTCGAYITTSVQDKVLPGVTIPQQRLQTCVADRKEGGTWVRRFISTETPGAVVEWSPWVRTSFSHKDIENHMEDPAAHKKFMRFYKVTSFGAEYKTFFNQQEGGSAGGVRSGNCSLLADNYGAMVMDQDYMQPAYDGKFRVKGSLALAGYKGSDINTGTWNVIVRLKHKDTANWQTIGHFQCTHSSKKDKFPIMTFETFPTTILKEDQVIINITYSDNGIITSNPGLYFVPIRSYFLLEDENTRAGTNIAKTFSKFLGNVDVAGEVGVRVHHADLANVGSTIRVYGEKLSHTPKEMTKLQ